MNGPDISVLLVDNDPHTCGIFQMVMDHHKLPLTTFENAEEAITHLETHVPNIAVFDLFLPGMDGYQALAHIRKTGLAPGCKFVATTAYYTDYTEREVLSSGFDGYIAKPFSVENLVAYLAKIMDNPNL